MSQKWILKYPNLKGWRSEIKNLFVSIHLCHRIIFRFERISKPKSKHFSDFAVGAPYDGPNGRGAVYIYYGSKEGIRKKYGQVIYAEAIQSASVSLSTFGFSLAGGIDLDGNEYPDMAVGSYLSDAAFFFRFVSPNFFILVY